MLSKQRLGREPGITTMLRKVTAAQDEIRRCVRHEELGFETRMDDPGS
jgi:hypothetical protein